MVQDIVTEWAQGVAGHLYWLADYVGENALWGAMASLTTIVWAKTQDTFRYRKLRRAFGRKIRSHRNLIVSVPLWVAITGDRARERFLRRDYLGNEERYYGPDDMFNYNDALAAASLHNLFGDFFPKPIRHLHDGEEPAWSNNTVIMVGSPVANLHARRLLADPSIDTFKLRVPKFVDVIEDEATGARTKIVIEDGREFSSSADRDYGAVIRLRNPHSKKHHNYVFIVAGIHAESTQEAGRILRDHWSLFAGKGDVKALVFEMIRARQLTGRVVHKIGIR